LDSEDLTKAIMTSKHEGDTPTETAIFPEEEAGVIHEDEVSIRKSNFQIPS
jgi:hypothetical protein